MTSSSLVQRSLPLLAAISLLVVSAFVAFAPTLLPVAHAQSSTLITGDELLPSEFGDNVGLAGGDIRVTVARLIRSALSFLGVVAVVIVLWGGVRWMTSGSEKEKVADAQKIMVSGLIGFAIILSAWAITTFVLNQLVSAVSVE